MSKGQAKKRFILDDYKIEFVAVSPDNSGHEESMAFTKLFAAPVAVMIETFLRDREARTTIYAATMHNVRLAEWWSENSHLLQDDSNEGSAARLYACAGNYVTLMVEFGVLDATNR